MTERKVPVSGLVCRFKFITVLVAVDATQRGHATNGEATGGHRELVALALAIARLVQVEVK